MEEIVRFILSDRNGLEKDCNFGFERVVFFCKNEDELNLKRFEMLAKFYKYFSIDCQLVKVSTSKEITDYRQMHKRCLLFSFVPLDFPLSIHYATSKNRTELSDYSFTMKTYFLQIQQERSGKENQHDNDSDLLQSSCIFFDLFEKKLLNWNKPITFSNSENVTPRAVFCQYTIARIEGIMRECPHISFLYKNIRDLLQVVGVPEYHNNNSVSLSTTKTEIGFFHAGFDSQDNDFNVKNIHQQAYSSTISSLQTVLSGENPKIIAQMIKIVASIEQSEKLLIASLADFGIFAKFINEFGTTHREISKLVCSARVKTTHSKLYSTETPIQTQNDARGLFFSAILQRMSLLWDSLGLSHVKRM